MGIDLGASITLAEVQSWIRHNSENVNATPPKRLGEFVHLVRGEFFPVGPLIEDEAGKRAERNGCEFLPEGNFEKAGRQKDSIELKDDGDYCNEERYGFGAAF